MNTELTLILATTAILHLTGFWLLFKHRRHVAHHRAAMPVIGSDPKLTEALHARLAGRQPQTDWLNPHVMRTKVRAFMRREQETTHRES